MLQKWYADDANATGKASALREYFDLIASIGPHYGYHVKPSKCWLIVHPGHADDARRSFGDVPINITEEGHEVLGSAVGTDEFTRTLVDQKCAEFMLTIDRLKEIASDEPHLAYSALVHCAQSQWQFFLRTTPLATNALERVDDAITTNLLPVMLRRSVISDIEREWLTLPVRDGGLGIKTWTGDEVSSAYKESVALCQPLMESVAWNQRKHEQECIAARIRRDRYMRQETRTTTLHTRLNPAQQRAREIGAEKGGNSWLHTRPLETQGYHLTAVEFCDAVALRMAWLPTDLPKTCQCGVAFTISHALSCPLGGLPTIRHNETRDLLADVMTEVCHSVAVEPLLTPVNARTFNHSTTTTDPNARTDIVASGVWGGRFERVFFDVCVFNAFALSNTAKPLPSVYEYHERRKNAKYAERVREVEHSGFSPLIFSSSGGSGKMAAALLKRLSALLAIKRRIAYADSISWLRRRISFALLRANTQCLRGARSKLHSPQHLCYTSIQATNAIALPENT